MWLFFMVLFSMSSYTTRWGWSLSFSELRTGRKVRKCRILTICADLSISTYLSITWPSCNFSGRIGFIFGLLVGRWHPYSVTQKIWHCCVSSLVAVKFDPWTLLLISSTHTQHARAFYFDFTSWEHKQQEQRNANHSRLSALDGRC